MNIQQCLSCQNSSRCSTKYNMTHCLCFCVCAVKQLKNLDFEELQLRLTALDPMMEREIEELRQRYTAKRQPILDAMDAKKRRQQNFWGPLDNFGSPKPPWPQRTSHWLRGTMMAVFVGSPLLFRVPASWPLNEVDASFTPILTPGIYTRLPCFYTSSRCCSIVLSLIFVSTAPVKLLSHEWYSGLWPKRELRRGHIWKSQHDFPLFHRKHLGNSSDAWGSLSSGSSSSKIRGQWQAAFFPQTFHF